MEQISYSLENSSTWTYDKNSRYQLTLIFLYNNNYNVRTPPLHLYPFLNLYLPTCFFIIRSLLSSNYLMLNELCIYYESIRLEMGIHWDYNVFVLLLFCYYYYYNKFYYITFEQIPLMIMFSFVARLFDLRNLIANVIHFTFRNRRKDYYSSFC